MYLSATPAPPSGNATFGVIMQTMLYMTNFTDRSLNNTLEDFYHLPVGAGTGKFYLAGQIIIIIEGFFLVIENRWSIAKYILVYNNY